MVGHSGRMFFRDLTIRVLGDFSNEDYGRLAHRIGHCLRAEGLEARAILVTDGRISGTEMDRPYRPDRPGAPRHARSRL